MTVSTNIVAIAAADLIFGARIRAAALDAGAEPKFVRGEAELLEAAASARLVILDLDARWVDASRTVAALKSDARTRAVPVVAFVSHVRVDAIEAARAAGAEHVLPRSAFVRLLPELLAVG